VTARFRQDPASENKGVVSSGHVNKQYVMVCLAGRLSGNVSVGTDADADNDLRMIDNKAKISQSARRGRCSRPATTRATRVDSQ
jgi:hypothetical protein